MKNAMMISRTRMQTTKVLPADLQNISIRSNITKKIESRYMRAEPTHNTKE